MAAGLSPSKLIRSLGDLCFPRGCPACAEPPVEKGVFCADCTDEIEYLQNSGPLPQGAAFDALHSLAKHDGPMAQAVRGFKYQGRWASGAALAKMVAMETPPEWLGAADLLAPVPLHWRRLIKRGFNQALVLVRPLAKAHGITLAPSLLKRRRHTRPQVGLNPQARRANVAGAFTLAANSGGQVKGARILLVDDVFTTGATVNECAQVLKDAGASRVEVFTVVRAF